MAPDKRETLFTVKLSDGERAMLQALADKDGLTAADIVRLLIRRAHREAFGENGDAKPKPRKKR